MRIALVLDPPAQSTSSAEWLRRAVDQGSLAVVTLPAIDPLTRSLGHALEAHEAGDGEFLVLSRVGSGRVEAREWEELGVAKHVTRLEAVEDPAVEGAIVQGAKHLDAGDLDRAERAYELADSLLAWDHGPRRAEVLVCLAGIQKQRGEAGAAAILLDRALAIFPDHRAALLMRIELARSEADAATSAALRRRLLRRSESDTERAELLSSIADESLLATTEALQRALELRPKDPRLLERLQATLEAAGRWREAVDAKVALSETIESERDRARSLTAAAGMCARRTSDVARAVALYEAAIADDPSTPGAFEAIESVLVKSLDYKGVELAYERQLERLAGQKTRDAEEALLEKLATLRRERLSNVRGAIVALDRLVVLRPKNIEARARLASLLEETDQLDLAARCLEAAALWGPNRPETFRDLHRLCNRIGDVDRGYCACAVLVHLGEADLEEQDVYRRFAPETTPRPQAALDAAGWAELYAPEHDDVVSRIVAAIAPAAIQLQKSVELPKSERQDPEKSTLTAVRTVAWAAAVLGLPTPAIYAKNEEFAGGIATPRTAEPALVLGKSLLSGRSIPELAFAIGRELASQHLTQRLVTFFPTVPELRSVIVAGIAQVVPSSLGSEAMALREGMRTRMTPAQRAELERAVEALQARDGRFDLKRWMRSIELAACRAGLLVSGDITAAARMLAVDGRVVGGLSAADRVRDLVPFSVSERCSKVRRAIGIGAAEIAQS